MNELGEQAAEINFYQDPAVYAEQVIRRAQTISEKDQPARQEKYLAIFNQLLAQVNIAGHALCGNSRLPANLRIIYLQLKGWRLARVCSGGKQKSLLKPGKNKTDYGLTIEYSLVPAKTDSGDTAKGERIELTCTQYLGSLNPVIDSLSLTRTTDPQPQVEVWLNARRL